jgi:hypothetical protein
MKLFYDDEFDALQQMIAGSDRTVKQCAAFLRPDLKPESSYAWLKTCLNPQGDQNLKFGQVVSLARYCGRFDALYYMADELTHARPGPLNPRDEIAQLQRNYIEAVHQARDIADRMERLARSPLQTVSK